MEVHILFLFPSQSEQTEVTKVVALVSASTTAYTDFTVAELEEVQTSKSVAFHHVAVVFFCFVFVCV